jgi:predicted kinase
VLPWALVQFGGMALVLGLALARPIDGAVGLKLGWVIFFYALAKLFELSDHAIFDATHQLLSGHTLKHLAAALAALPVLHALQAMGRQTLRHNPGAATVTV